MTPSKNKYSIATTRTGLLVPHHPFVILTEQAILRLLEPRNGS